MRKGSSQKSVWLGVAVGIAVVGIALFVSWLSDVGVAKGWVQKTSLFLLVAPYALLNVILSWFSLSLPSSLAFVTWIFIVAYWVLVGGILGGLWGSSKTIARAFSVLLFVALLLGHGWSAVEFERKTAALGQAIIGNFARGVTKWQPVIDTIIREESAKEAVSR